MQRAEEVMKGCLRCNSGLEHELPITQYNMETVVIDSLFVKDRSEVIVSRCLPCRITSNKKKIYICGATL